MGLWKDHSLHAVSIGCHWPESNCHCRGLLLLLLLLLLTCLSTAAGVTLSTMLKCSPLFLIHQFLTGNPNMSPCGICQGYFQAYWKIGQKNVTPFLSGSNLSLAVLVHVPALSVVHMHSKTATQQALIGNYSSSRCYLVHAGIPARLHLFTLCKVDWAACGAYCFTLGVLKCMCFSVSLLHHSIYTPHMTCTCICPVVCCVYISLTILW